MTVLHVLRCHYTYTVLLVAGLLAGCDRDIDSQVRRLAVEGLQNPRSATVEFQEIQPGIYCGTVSVTGASKGGDQFAVIFGHMGPTIYRMSDIQRQQRHLGEKIEELNAFTELSRVERDSIELETERAEFIDRYRREADERLAELEGLKEDATVALMAFGRCAGFDPT